MADLCFHCGALPDADGDHTCPCPLSDAECLERGVSRVHNHRPYQPVCNERLVDGQLRGACLNDDGTDRIAREEASRG